MIEVRLPNKTEKFFQLIDLGPGDIFMTSEDTIFVAMGAEATYMDYPIVFNAISLVTGRAHYIPLDTIVEPITIDFNEDEEEEDEREDL